MLTSAHDEPIRTNSSAFAAYFLVIGLLSIAQRLAALAATKPKALPGPASRGTSELRST